MWIDPLEVSYRIGENGSICVLYEYKEGVSEPWKPSTNLNNKNSASTNQNAKNALTTVTPTTTPANKNIESLDASVPSCKESLRNMDYLLDPRKSGSIEHLAAYVSS